MKINLERASVETFEPENISLLETARLLNAQLQKRFPGTAFSVQSMKYAGGSTIHISWTDGPSYCSVNEVSQGFAGAEFDPVVDGYVRQLSWLKPTGAAELALPGLVPPCDGAELVSFAGDFVDCRREVSAEAWSSFKAVWAGFSEFRRGALVVCTDAYRVAATQPEVWCCDETLSAFGRDADNVFRALFRHCGVEVGGAIHFPERV